MMHVSPGFTSPETVQTFGFYIPETQIPDTSPALVVRMDEAIAQKIASLPGVSSVSIGSSVPMDNNAITILYLFRIAPMKAAKFCDCRGSLVRREGGFSVNQLRQLMLEELHRRNFADYRHRHIPARC